MLVDIYAIGFGFINEKFIEIICKRFEIQSQRLKKLKLRHEFDSRAAKPINHFIYPMLSMRKHIKSLVLL